MFSSQRWTVSRRLAAIVLALSIVPAASSRADVVTDWNRNLWTAVRTGNTNPLFSTRVMAIVQAAVFDAVNGIERRYTPVHVAPAAPRGASRRAAAIEAAYATLKALYPAQSADLTTKRDASLDSIVDDPEDVESSQSIARGIEWGDTVAAAILAWRASDGFSSAPATFTGGTDIGQWRPTPPNSANGVQAGFPTMTPWVMTSFDQFRPGPPPNLASAAYAADFNETKTTGQGVAFPPAPPYVPTSVSTPQQEVALFWNGNTPGYWNRIAVQVSEARDLTLSENAHLLALLNIAMADAGIACWDAKYWYEKAPLVPPATGLPFRGWRPVTAIVMADFDGNPDTVADAAWTPYLVATPAHPEYPSGHSTVSGAASSVLAARFGDQTSFTLDSELRPGHDRQYESFSAALADVHNARVFGGIHFRFSCLRGSAVGKLVAEYVLGNALQRVHGH